MMDTSSVTSQLSAFDATTSITATARTACTIDASATTSIGAATGPASPLTKLTTSRATRIQYFVL